MSRCFPFPPPGYEAKPRSEHKDLLKKEKHKEKKHKKERKDRGKRERKEKNRDHRKDKHNKKYKREKRKDRKKNKERDKDKRQTLEQETQKNDDLGNRRRPKERVQNEAVEDSKPADELVSQNIGQEYHANHTVSSTSKFPQSIVSFSAAGSKEKGKTSLSRVVEKSGRTAHRNHTIEKGKDSGHGSKTRIQNGKSLQFGSAEKHSARRHSSNGMGLRHESSLYFAQRSSEDVCATTAATQQNGRIAPSPNTFQRTEQVDQHSDVFSYSAYGNSDGMSIKGMMEKENGSANIFYTRTDQQSVRGKDGTVQVKGMVKDVKAYHHRGIKDRDRDCNVNHKDVKKRKANDKNKDKEKMKKGVVNEKIHKEIDAHGRSKSNVDDLMVSAHLNGKKFTSDDVKKRKDLEADSPVHEHSTQMTKLPRMSPAYPACANGETVKNSQVTASWPSTVPVGTNTCEASRLQDSKKCHSNGITGSHCLEEHKASVSSDYDSSEVSPMLPHPDTKYLRQLYSIPAVDDFSEYIDQNWLSSGDCVHQKTAMYKAAESPQVWDEARPIDSADTIALPYIVPL